MAATNTGIRAILALFLLLLIGSLPACGTPRHRSDEPAAPEESARHSSVDDVLAANRPGWKSPWDKAAHSGPGPEDGSGGGRAIYERRCVSCHQLHDPAEYTDPEWRTIVRVMARNAHLSAGDERKVLAYLQASN